MHHATAELVHRGVSLPSRFRETEARLVPENKYAPSQAITTVEAPPAAASAASAQTGDAKVVPGAILAPNASIPAWRSFSNSAVSGVGSCTALTILRAQLPVAVCLRELARLFRGPQAAPMLSAIFRRESTAAAVRSITYLLASVSDVDSPGAIVGTAMKVFMVPLTSLVLIMSASFRR